MVIKSIPSKNNKSRAAFSEKKNQIKLQFSQNESDLAFFTQFFWIKINRYLNDFLSFSFFEKNSQQKESNFYKKTSCIFLVYFYNKFDEILREKRADE